MNYKTEWQKKQDKFLRRMHSLRAYNDETIKKINELNDEYLKEKAVLIKNCGTFLSLSATADNEIHVNAANFCRERLCAVCAWRRQSKFVATTYPALEHLERAGYIFVFITLTVPNCTESDLSDSIANLLHNFTILTHKKLLKSVKGYVRSVETTYNATTNTFHPHIHAIFIMPPDYSPIASGYISQAALTEAWRKINKFDFPPIVHIQLLRTSSQRKGYIEAMKYSLKPSAASPSAIAAIYYALHGKRLISFGGILKSLRRDIADGDLTDNKPTTNIIAQTLYRLNSSGGTYEIIEQIITDRSGRNE